MGDLNPAPDSLDSAAVRQIVERLNAGSPKYGQLYFPLPAEAADAFERKWKIRLPSDYRYVVTQLGNGVRGVLFPLGMEQMRGEDYTRAYADLGLIGDIGQPFPLTEAWNLPEELLDQPIPSSDATREEKECLYQEWSKKLETATKSIVNGAIPISTLGCGQVMWLVVNGPQNGYVWNDSMADNLGIFPLRDANGQQITFTDWFLRELRAAAV